MKPFGEIFSSIQKMENSYEGSFSIKNSQREYLHVNDEWLNSKQLFKKDVIGKRDEEIFLNGNALEAIRADMEVLKKKTPLESAFTIYLKEKEICYFTIKWVVESESALFLCTLGDVIRNKERVLDFRKNIDELYMSEIRC